MVKHRTIVISVLIVIILIVSSTSAIVVMNKDNNSGERIVVNKEMLVSGIEKDGVVMFKGIPYAEAPVGDLRFAPPVAKKMWTEVLDCTSFGNIAVQSPMYHDGVHGPIEHSDNESEDCLNLNIWAPADAKAGSNYPVYVWIHGGGFATGSGSDHKYEGTEFAQDGVIVVTFNYRIGMLGYLCLDSLRDDNAMGTSGNWGTLDQILALKWVHDNISKFGGDVNNITLGGGSAGGISVFNLITSPLTKGYFQKAIIQSGGPAHNYPTQYSYEDAVGASRLLVSQFGVDDDAQGIETLRGMSAYELSDASYFDAILTADHSTALVPVADGVVLPTKCLDVIEDGEYDTDVKMIIGYNKCEGTLFTKSDPSEAEFDYLIDNAFIEEYRDDVRDYYDGRTSMTLYEKTLELTGCTTFKLGPDKIQKMFSRNGNVVYGYEYLHVMRTPEEDVLPIHCAETEFTFGHDSANDYEMDANDRAIRDLMHGYWVNFIKTGDPNGSGFTQWTQYDEEEDLIMAFLENESVMSAKSDESVFQVLSPWYFPDNP